MDRKEILLSICIPTFNRCEVLERSLQTYINDPSFDERVEIVISDNCSTDDTEAVIKKYLTKYNNIRYHRLNETICADLNMNKVLSMGNGLYLKLMNDTISLKPRILEKMLKIIDKKKLGISPIFFYQNIHFLNSNKIIICSNINELVSNVSFYIGWIANFGIWRTQYDALEEKDRLAHLQFPMADLTIRLILQHQNSVIYFKDYFSVAELKKKGGYNVFSTFAVNYLSIYDEYLIFNKLENRIYNREKYRLYRYLLMPWYKNLVINKSENLYFEKEHFFKIIFTKYGKHFYAYAGFILLYILLIFKNVKSIKKYIINRSIN